MTIPLFRCPHSQEQERLQRIIEAQERELDHRANIISEQADELARRSIAQPTLADVWRLRA